MEECALRWTCIFGHYDICEWLLQIELPQSVKGHEGAFINSCTNGHLQVSKLLLQYKSNINIYLNNDYIFRWTCSGGYFDVVKWLYSLKEPSSNTLVRSCNWSFDNGHLEIVRWLINKGVDLYQCPKLFLNDNFSSSESSEISISFVIYLILISFAFRYASIADRL